jgi:hypothetical protein
LFDCSEVRISSSCTAVAVWVAGMVSPLPSSGTLGLPGRTSRKKFPSRKRRGLIVTVASSWIGRPSSETVKVASAISPFESTSVTSPTLTPAIRTGESNLNVAAFSNVAWSS